jgi:hypothetical protein
VQSGFAHAALESLCRSTILAGLFLLMPLLVHPVLAVFLVVLFQEDLFYSLRFLLLTAIRTTGGNPLLPFLEKASYAVYMALPSFAPFASRLEGVHASMRASAADWKALGSIAIYAAASTALFFLLSAVTLRRRALS